jgi:hypothetical protein
MSLAAHRIEPNRHDDGSAIVRQPWGEHFETLPWHQGDHLLIAAPTKAGKTTMVRRLADKRSHSVMLVTKTHDPTIRNEFKGWDVLRSWPPSPWQDKVLLWPKPQRTARATLMHQRGVFGEALDRIFRGNRDGWSGWNVIVDESHYLTSREFCDLGPAIAMLHHQGRSAGVSMVNLTQRPAWIPKIIYSSVTHAWIARTRDMDDLKRLADLGGIDPRQMRDTVARLPSRHDYVYVNPQGDARPVIVNTRK